MSSPVSTRLIPIAKILREWGIRGQVRAILFNPDSEIFFQQKKFFLEGEIDSGPLQLKSAKPHGKFWLLHFKGFENPESVQVLRGKTLQIPRESLAKIDKTEIYLADLEGLKVIGPEQQALGRVLSFQRVGESDVMMVGENIQDSVGVPYESDFVEKTSIEEGYIQLKAFALELFSL